MDHSYGHEHQNSEFFWRIKHVYDWVQLKCIYIWILDVDTTWPIIYDPGGQEKCQRILNIVVITLDNCWIKYILNQRSKVKFKVQFNEPKMLSKDRGDLVII